jgi:hypothetical protein
MSNDVQVYDAQPMDIVRNPKLVLAEAKEAATQLVAVVRQAHLARKFGGEKEHLFFEAWQTLGKFYGCTPRVSSTVYVEFGTAHGFEAHADVIDRCGNVVSSAEAMCLNDEGNWKNKPLFQLKSMAQTRACSKALRNVFAWVAVLAGYEATPAEEMTGEEKKDAPTPPQSKSGQQPPADAKKDLRVEINRMLLESEGNEFDASEKLKELSGFMGKNKETQEEKWIDGKGDPKEFSEKMLPVAYGKVKTYYTAWKTAQETKE